MHYFIGILFCLQVFLIQNSLCQWNAAPYNYQPGVNELPFALPDLPGGYPPNFPYGSAPRGLAADYGYSVGLSPYGGVGDGNVVATGELAVAGNTVIFGQVPVNGAVRFEGGIPAAGAIIITGNCDCGCNNAYYYGNYY